MWKCARSSLKATFRNGVFRCNAVLSTKARKEREPPPGKNCFLKLTPDVLQHYNHFYNLCKKTSENFSEKKDSEEPRAKTGFFEFFHSDLFCVLKWSSILTVGYGYLQYKLKTYSIFDRPDQFSIYNTDRHHKTLGYISDVIGIKPYNCVIPEVQAAKSKNCEECPSDIKSKEVNFSAIEKAYQKVLGTLNNSLGTQCMLSGQHKEALEYFIQSAEGEHAPGIFNLGICYEKGLGTSQNFQRAAELYQKAADLGHATAMYNLGVFYAQGIGGIKVDLNHAQELFKAAAELGQTNAIQALKLEEKASGGNSTYSSVSDRINKEHSSLSQFLYNMLMNRSECTILENFNSDDEFKSRLDSFEHADKNDCSASLGSDSGVLDLSPEGRICPGVLFNPYSSTTSAAAPNARTRSFSCCSTNI